MDVVGPVLVWWLALVVIGWAAVPVAWRLFPTLPDRGVAVARPLGLIVVGYVFWLGGTAGLVPNSRAGALAAVGVLVWAAAWVVVRDGAALRAFLGRRWRLVIGCEALFLAGLVAWAFYRSHVPAIETSGGEKYMEMAFINAVVHSPRFPPLDPWLSGYAISYYYFGYLIAGMLIRLTGISPSIAFNLVVPMTLGMTLVGAFGLGYDLVGLSGASRRATRVLTGALSALVLALVGNLSGLVEVGFLRGWGSPRFYQWLGIRELTPDGVCDGAGGAFGAGRALAEGVSRIAGWIPSRHIWWWRGSRIIQDNCGEVIHEFPFFSFMLGDVHPHVVALPFVLLVLGVALAVLAGALEHRPERPYWSAPWLLLPLVVGALGFLNTWDLPTFGLLVVVAYALRAAAGAPAPVPATPDRTDRAVAAFGLAGLVAAGWLVAPAVLGALRGVPPEAQPALARVALALAIGAAGAAGVYAVWTRAVAGGEGARRVIDVGRFAVWLVTLAVAFYLPFYVGFSSQAGGVGVVEVRSRLPQWLVHFALPWFLAVSVTLGLAPAARRRWSWPALVAAVVLGAVGLAALVARAWTAAALSASALAAFVVGLELWAGATAARGGSHADVDRSADDGPSALPAAPPGSAAQPAVPPERRPALPVAPTFALACVSLGLLLPLATEFVFVRDLFNSRMNTVFKLYYQAWVLLAVGGAYALVAVRGLRVRAIAAAWIVVAALLVGASLIYPVASVYTRTNGLRVDVRTLDGLAWWQQANPDDVDAAAWLRANAPEGAVLLEAYGGAYEHNGRLSMATGRPAVLGWEWHENQWRGTREAIEPRKADIDQMYKSTDHQTVIGLLDRYDVRYVVVGDPERAKFDLGAGDVERFQRWFTTVHMTPSGHLIIFERR